MYDYDWMNPSPWRQENYYITNVMLETGITHVGAESFYLCADISSISIPDTVISIGDFAFFCCFGVADLYIPLNLMEIGKGAFSGWNNLSSITVDLNNPVYDSRDNCNATSLLLSRYPLE